MTDALDAGLPAPSESEEVNQTEPNTPEATAAEGVVEVTQEKSFKPIESQAELDSLIQKRLLKEERRYARRMENQLREQQQARVLEEPKRDEFRDDRAFYEAQIEHLAEKKAAEKVAERERIQQQERISESFLEKAERVQDRYPDFSAVVGNPTLTINEGMAEFIADSDTGPDIAYFLGKNPIKAQQIAQLSPIKAARELTRIEAELTAKPKPRLSTAPAPISPIGGSKGGDKSPAEMTDAEYAKWRRTALK